MLIFKAATLLPVIEEAKRKQCMLVLEKRHWVCLYPATGDRNADGFYRNIAYPIGCNPEVDMFDVWFNKAFDEFGIEDVTEWFSLEDQVFTIVQQHHYDMFVEARGDQLIIGYLQPLPPH